MCSRSQRLCLELWGMYLCVCLHSCMKECLSVWWKRLWFEGSHMFVLLVKIKLGHMLTCMDLIPNLTALHIPNHRSCNSHLFSSIGITVKCPVNSNPQPGIHWHTFMLSIVILHFPWPRFSPSSFSNHHYKAPTLIVILVQTILAVMYSSCLLLSSLNHDRAEYGSQHWSFFSYKPSLLSFIPPLPDLFSITGRSMEANVGHSSHQPWCHMCQVESGWYEKWKYAELKYQRSRNR